ncbi:hypothetical protein [Sinorhizobium meliloti]|nr:hypothetical protein [Sinorhizobium meliloti]
MAPLEAAFALFKTFCITCRATTLNAAAISGVTNPSPRGQEV